VFKGIVGYVSGYNGVIDTTSKQVQNNK